MIQALVSLQRLWYLILMLSTVCLVADITLSSTQSGTQSPEFRFYVFPLALAADVPTVLIFAYCIWGKANPLLLPSSSPKSNVCTRCLRGTGSVLLVLLWIANTILYSVSLVVVRKVLAGVAAMIAILILVEMIGSGRLGRQQRWFLKQERRRQEQAKLDLVAGSVAAQGDVSEQGKGSASSASAGRRGQGEGGRWGMDSREGLLGDSSSVHTDDVVRVEIVRPPSVGAAQVIFNQQLMYEMYQRQYHQHQQQFLMNHQQPLGTQSNTTGNAEVDGKYDDLLLESSFKFEIPMDEPLQGPSLVQTGALESLLVAKKVVIYPPSAPTIEKTLPSTASVTWPSASAEPKAQSLSVAKDDIQRDTIRILNDSNPCAKESACMAIQELASAPPSESSSASVLTQLDSIPRPASSISSCPVQGVGLSENKQQQ
ncbi:hypothetical protein BGZ70_002287 [Mortierella alpina]|uniref:Uncharacterized protein n=1 Tax=Mortierella alpina TaxID=64518 RepID=A0A9P6JDK1_MORAP|nr:hypothetical protein BGZ70_002287 [Mortierella alpina]